MFRPRLLAALLLAPSLVLAQQPQTAARPAAAPQAAPAAGPAQQAQLTKQNTEMTQAALRVAQMVDANQVASLWDGASSVAKTAVKRDVFVSQIGAERARLGAVVGRGQGSVTRVKYAAGAQVPEGLYVNVSFPTRFAKAQQPVRELVSFRLDEDKTWRLAGYSLRASIK
ncbi:DUF4019 domain-containing protein [Xanthomonas arboricola pv. juglandis]|uniref:DUF4019 domain-containing protein n=1 Tax=Xanthomonas campestris pv. juglandis TaxID=195709 RepID=A0A8E4ELQ2_XANCJ|nr:DUF4019 domain-containing protein [Xanthomonas arboricola]AKU50382.1 hypothetical protein AKJ12_11825 [Xanthomonas arboricola pv. juglandis]KOB02446.1 hypothetical protein AE921_05750 [Xanthomonas arboricola]KOB03377.1 hypothetical protein AE920_00110 [Xanthomonas arboricola]KOB08012.1 hypothetical protein AE922_11780 [Xanthomonas arboricola]KOB10919.1 hypothetical protein AE923_05430 [Xanthomonas arboricola]